MKGGLNDTYISVDGADGYILGTHVCRITAHNRRGCGDSESSNSSGSSGSSSAIFCLKMMVLVLEFFLHGVKHEPVRGGVNPAIGITNYVGCLTGTVLIHDSNNNGQDASAVRGAGNNILDRVKGMGRMKDFRLCRINQGVVTFSMEYQSCLVFVVTFF